MPAIRMIYNNEKGMVLPLGLIFLAIIAILGTTAVIITTTDIKISSNYKTSVQAFYNAEAGLARAEAELINDLNIDNDLSNTSFETISGTIAIVPSSAAFYTPAGFNNIPFGAGDYTIQFKNYAPDPTAPNVYHPAIIWVRSIGTAPNSSTVTLESYLSAENISPWNNAIFAGGGGSAVPITGNVIIAGSVHILGEGLPATTTVFNNQTGDCRNNSTTVPPAIGMDGTLASKVDGGASSDLNAKFRVKNGQVDMSLGVGDIGALSNPFKGIYVTDGDDGDGDGVNDDIMLGGAASIYADKGATSAKAYDLGNYNTTLPIIDTALLNANSLNLTATTEVDGWGTGLNAGALELTGKHKEGSTWYCPDIDKTDGTNSIFFNSNTNLLIINGIIKAVSLNISDNITYAGRGTIYTTGTAATVIGGNVLPDTAASYPTTNVFGVVSTGNIAMGGGAQILLTGAYYSAGEIETDLQTELAGTIVCKNFDITNQTPKIWQVPSLATNLPPGMPGSTPVWVFTDRTWREIIK